MEHQADHGEGDHRFGDLGEFLVIPGQAAPAAEPTERSLDHPSAREDNEAGPGDAAHDDQRQAEQEAGEQDWQAVVDAVGKHRPEPAVQRLDPAQQLSGAVGVLNVGGVDQDAQQEAAGIDGDVAFASPNLLGGIIAARPPFSVVLTL